MTVPALELQGITHAFGDVRALEGVSLLVRPGTIHAVLGENGAGKSTLMRIAFGMLRPQRGTINIHGTARVLRSSRDARSAGLGMVHQHFSLVPSMRVTENIALGGRGLFSPAIAAARVAKLVETTGLAVDPDARVGDLGVGAQQRVELLKALAGDATVLILDEPTAVLTPTESEELFAWVRRYVAAGHAVILITHKLREALALADDVTVLRHGRVVISASASTLDEAALVTAMTGDTAWTTTERVTPGTRGAMIAALKDVTAQDARGTPRLRNVSAELYAGEVVGVAGVEGSGVHELLRLFASQQSAVSGQVQRPDTIGFVPEDRHRDAMISALSLRDNFALRGAGQRRGLMPWDALAADTTRVMHAHDVRAAAPSVRAADLSGGNQQKFVVGRELDGAPTLMIAENPVRGLDVKATAHVMDALRAHAHAGGSVVVHASDIDELLPIADRMLVVFNGRVSECPVDRAQVARAMVGL